MFVKKNDQVVVLTGADKKKKGKVLVVNPDDNRVIVEGVKIQAKHTKPRGQTPGGIKKSEGAIDASNVQVICPECGLPTRPSYKEGAEGKKMRVCKKCGKSLDKRVSEKKEKKDKKERKSKKEDA